VKLVADVKLGMESLRPTENLSARPLRRSLPRQEYLGRYLVDDTGGNVLGATLDIWNPDCKEAGRFGRHWGSAVLVAREVEQMPNDSLMPTRWTDSRSADSRVFCCCKLALQLLDSRAKILTESA